MRNDSNTPLKRLIDISQYAASFFCIFSVALFLFWLIQRTGIEKTPFDTDEADHANAALELYTWASRGDLGGTFNAIVRQAFYPPIHSLFIALSYGLSDVSIPATRVPTVVLFSLYLMALFLSVHKISKRILSPDGIKGSLPLMVGSAVLLAAATSPISVSNAVLCMLEITGMLAVTFVLLFACRLKTDQPPRTGSLVLLGLLGVSVFLVKYSFGIVTLPAIGAALVFTPNFRSSGGAALKAIVVLAFSVLIPLALWVLITDRSAMYHFFVGHKSYAPLLSSENIFFEIRSWFSVYCINFQTALWSAVFAIIGGFSAWRHFAVRIAVFNTLFALLIFFLSTTNEERHFMVAIPSILFLSGAGVIWLILCIRKFDVPRSSLSGLLCFTLILSVILGIPDQVTNLDAKITKGFEGRPDFYELFAFISENIDPRVPVIVNGVSDDFGIEALRWMVAASHKLAYTEVVLESFPFRDDKQRTALLRKRNVDIPYREKNFPKKPFSSVLAKTYYKYGIQITKLFEEQRFKKEAEDFLNSVFRKDQKELTRGGRRIVVYTLK